MSQRYDLHTHTLYSDGSLSPAALCEEALKIGLSGLSITDHDSIEAYRHLPKSSLKIGVGVEFSCMHKGESVHVLGYDFNLQSPHIEALCLKHKQRRYNRNRAILANLEKWGIRISESELYKDSMEHTIGRPHIAEILVSRGICSTMESAFNHYLAEGKKAYAPGDPISVEETIDVIHQASGKVFIAHPHLIKKNRLIKDLLSLPFDGLEGYYARFSALENDQWVKKGLELGWLISGGSDFHGELKTFNRLGSAWVNEELFQKIFAHPL